MASESKPIIYGITEINGIPVRPNSRDVLIKSLKTGQPIEVLSGNDYINLYHVFERMHEHDRTVRGYVLVRKQIGQSKWWVFVTKDRGDVPEVELNKGYDPKRGRYKRYAEQLAEGNALTFADKAEAIKARRAWQLYVPQSKRKHLRSRIARVGKSGKYLVSILERDV